MTTEITPAKTAKPAVPTGKNLYQRIAAVMGDVAYLNKDKQVGDGGYSYKAVSEESVTGTVREKMIKHGLVMFPVSQAHRHEELPRIDKYGKASLLSLTTVDVTYKLVNVDNPAEFELIASSGTGVDPQDKGVGKAMTYAFKYALLRTFAIPTGNDPDMVHNDVLEQQAPAADVTPPKPAPVAVMLATPDQRAAIMSLLNQPEITTAEYDRMVPALDTMGTTTATQTIAKLTAAVADRANRADEVDFDTKHPVGTPNPHRTAHQ